MLRLPADGERITDDMRMMNGDVLSALADVIDPELGVNIVDLGLVYRAEWAASGIAVALTVTSPTCPFGDALIKQAEAALRSRFFEVHAIDVDLVWDPPWSPARITDDGRHQLGWLPSTESARKEPATRNGTSIRRREH